MNTIRVAARAYCASSSSRASSAAVRIPRQRRLYSASATDAPASSSADDAKPAESEGAKEPESELEKVTKAKDAEILDITSRLRYMTADFQNLQRISEREKQAAKEFAVSRFAADLLTTVDVLSLALKSVTPTSLTDNPKLAELYKGVDITQKQLLQTLAKHGVKPVDPIGEKFDPNTHEALYSAPIEGKEPGTIIDVQKLGYTIKDRTLRAAQVGVVADKS